MKASVTRTVGFACLAAIVGLAAVWHGIASPIEPAGGSCGGGTRSGPGHRNEAIEAAIGKTREPVDVVGLESRSEDPVPAEPVGSDPGADEEWQGYFRIQDDLIRACVYQLPAVSPMRVFRSVQLNPTDRYLDTATRAAICSLLRSIDARYTRWCNVVGESRGREMAALHAAGKLLRVTRDAFPDLWDWADKYAAIDYLAAHPERAGVAGWQNDEEFRGLLLGKLSGRLMRETEYTQVMDAGKDRFMATKAQLSDTCFVAHNAGLDEIRTELCDRLLDLMANAGCIDAAHRARLWNEFLAHLAAWRTTTARW